MNKPNKKTLCLVMIVRNESKVIKRCLDRVKDKIDYWVIVDTGSDDNTMEIIRETLKDIPGELHQQEWINFGKNRTQSLALAKDKADYLLLCDADEQIIFSDEFNTSNLNEDAYLIPYQGEHDYSVPYLIKGNINWRYVGVTHEYLDSDVNVEKVKIATLSILDLKDGGFKADKYERDIKLLEKGLIDEPDNARYMFYLANSYRDSGNYEKAAEWYEKRIAAKGWIEEVSVAYRHLGLCYKHLGKDKDALNTWLMGYDYNPARIESLYHAIQLLRENGNARLGYQLAKIAMDTPYPKKDILFVGRDIYNFWIFYEMSICAYYVNDFKKGYECCKKVLFNNPNPVVKEITINNLRFYKEFAKKDKTKYVQQLIEIIQDYLSSKDNEKAKETLAYLQKL